MKKLVSVGTLIPVMLLQPLLAIQSAYAVTNVSSETFVENNTSITSSCSAPATLHLKYASAKSHLFQGFGTNLQPVKNMADSNTAIADLNDLKFQFVKMDWGDPYNSNLKPAPINITDANFAAVSADIKTNVVSALQSTPQKLYFFQALHGTLPSAAQSLGYQNSAYPVSVVKTMYGAPQAYYETRPINQGTDTGNFILDARVGDFSAFYVAYLDAIKGYGMNPDYVELQNEPNGSWDVKFTPTQYASFVSGIFQTGDKHGIAPGNLTAAGTSTQVSNAVDYLTPLSSSGTLARMKGLALHTYYVTSNAAGDGKNNVPPADDVNFPTVSNLAKANNLPLMSTEFGGTDAKDKVIDPQAYSVNQAEEYKAALDLVRNGESMALVWNLYPNVKAGSGPIKNWGLIDNTVTPRVKTNAYYIFKTLANGLKSNSDVLSVASTDWVPDMTTLGHAGFRNGNSYTVGLSNPSATTATVQIDLSDSAPLSVNHIYSFTANQLLDRETAIARGNCGYTVTLPPNTGMLINMLTPPVLSKNPQGGSYYANSTATLSADAADSSGNTLWQWYRGNAAISGATGKDYSFSVNAGTIGNYTAAASNQAGTSTSAPAYVDMYTAPVITNTPLSLTLASGSAYTLSASAYGNPAPGYQWLLNGTQLAGSTAATLNLQLSKANAGTYSVTASNMIGSASANIAAINVLDPVVITNQPAGKSGPLGRSVILGVQNSGDCPCTYQWYGNGKVLAGKTGKQLTLTIGNDTVGAYYVLVGNAVSSVASDTVQVIMTH